MAEGCSVSKTKRSKDEQEAINCIRKIRLAILSAPKHLCALPKGAVYREQRIRPPASSLTYVPTKRINYLARPVPRKSVKKYKPKRPPKFCVKISALTYIPTVNLVKLAQPRNILAKFQKMIMEKSRQLQAKTKQVSKDHEAYRKKWLEMRARPKPKRPKRHIHPILVMFRGKRMFIRQKDVHKYMKCFTKKTKRKRRVNMSIINKLAIPTRRIKKYQIVKVPDRYVEKREADLNAPLSERLRKLGLPKALPEEALLDLNFQPFTVSKAAQKYVASIRVAELAEPRDRSEYDDDDVAEDAFTVPRRALKAICSKRTAELAMPIMRD